MAEEGGVALAQVAALAGDRLVLRAVPLAALRQRQPEQDGQHRTTRADARDKSAQEGLG